MPCPGCGSTNIVLDGSTIHDYWYHCECGWKGPTGTGETLARRKWNTRYIEAPKDINFDKREALKMQIAQARLNWVNAGRRGVKQGAEEECRKRIVKLVDELQSLNKELKPKENISKSKWGKFPNPTNEN